MLCRTGPNRAKRANLVVFRTYLITKTVTPRSVDGASGVSCAQCFDGGDDLPHRFEFEPLPSRMFGANRSPRREAHPSLSLFLIRRGLSRRGCKRIVEQCERL